LAPPVPVRRCTAVGCARATKPKCATVVYASTRNIRNRFNKNTIVFLASAKLAAIASKLDHIPVLADDFDAMAIENMDGAVVCKCLNFNQIEEYVENTKSVTA
jgi:aconitate hydratase 2/2-methylisocitrate dehydratase